MTVPQKPDIDREEWFIIPGWREVRFLLAGGKCLAEVSGTAREASLIVAAPALDAALQKCATEMEQIATAIEDPLTQARLRALAADSRAVLAGVDEGARLKRGTDILEEQPRKKRGGRKQ